MEKLAAFCTGAEARWSVAACRRFASAGLLTLPDAYPAAAKPALKKRGQSAALQTEHNR